MDMVMLLSTVAYVTYVIIIAITIVLILSENRDPVRSLTWVLVLICIPVAGFVAYLVFGQYYRKQKIISKRSIHKVAGRLKPEFDITKIDMSRLTAQQRNLVGLLWRNNDAVAYADNRIDVYTDGESTFEAMFAAIEQATEHIHVDFFIFGNDRVSNRLRELLIKKARQGVRVRMIYDYFGSFKLNKAYLNSLREAGVYTRAFLPARLKIGRTKINYRNHRKILVVDGKIGFTGGVNIADRYLYGNELGMWRDTFVRIEGAAVQGLQQSFLIDWYFVDQKLITDTKYYPQYHVSGNNLVQIVTSGPDSDWESIMQGIMQAITTATKYVYIHTPYFVPPENILGAIQTAALSGVDVRLMVPQKSDTPMLDAVTRTYLETVLESGARVFLYCGGHLHSKAIVIDDMVSTIGSANMDERSYNQNFEINAFIYDEPTALTLKQAFLKDMERSTEITLDAWRSRSRWKRFIESIARLCSPLL